MRSLKARSDLTAASARARELGDQVVGDIHPLLAATSLLLAVVQHQSAFALVEVARAEAQHLGDASPALPEALQQEALGLAGGGVDDGPRLLARDVAGQVLARGLGQQTGRRAPRQ